MVQPELLFGATSARMTTSSLESAVGGVLCDSYDYPMNIKDLLHKLRGIFGRELVIGRVNDGKYNYEAKRSPFTYFGRSVYFLPSLRCYLILESLNEDIDNKVQN
ncbi:hypothetical protein BPOR_0590g00020 [Botrytis porri]|uniref:Uncharacterized protein n=1 Tax=Botrytis porri TaxID=87229 RepID=A0A4Z1KCH9_9HELO|nr:hypothetical protein BPOR_0590g00020 [Botrytis porri]